MTGDLATGEGIQTRGGGNRGHVHLAGTPKGDEVKARHLVRAASQVGTRHLVYISVVGADRIPVVSGVDQAMFGYFASKLAAEKTIADSGLPWTTLRATQFHDGILLTVRQLSGCRCCWSRPDSFQPVDPGSGGPAGGACPWPACSLVPEVGGPRVYELAALVRIPAGPWQAPADRAGVAAGQGRPRVPGWREPGPGPGGGPPDLGGVPGRAGELAERQQIRPDIAPGRNGGRWPITLDGAWIDSIDRVAGSNGTGLPDAWEIDR